MLRSTLKKLSGSHCLEDLTREERRAMWPPAKPLQDAHLRHCRLLPDRYVMLNHLPSEAVCAEIGIWECEYSQYIWNVTRPRHLHLIDVDATATATAEGLFADEIADQRVSVHLGNSPDVLASLPANHFDWVYVDGDHSYEGAKRDLEASHRVIKSGGLIAVNDYIYFESSGFSKYGVVEAVNEFCIDFNYEWVYFALHGRLYNDVVLKQR